jgi:hypothetical protein
MWFVFKFVAALVLLRIMALGWEAAVICASPVEEYPIAAKIFSAFFSLIMYPLISLDFNGFNKSNGINLNELDCFSRHMISLKSYVWYYIGACIVIAIDMLGEKFKKS